MTADDARAFCNDLQERVNQMGERTGEGIHLGRCLSVIRDLAAQVDSLSVEVVRALAEDGVDEIAAPMDPLGTTRKVRRTKKTGDA